MIDKILTFAIWKCIRKLLKLRCKSSNCRSCSRGRKSTHARVKFVVLPGPYLFQIPPLVVPAYRMLGLCGSGRRAATEPTSEFPWGIHAHGRSLESARDLAVSTHTSLRGDFSTPSFLAGEGWGGGKVSAGETLPPTPILLPKGGGKSPLARKPSYTPKSRGTPSCLATRKLCSTFQRQKATANNWFTLMIVALLRKYWTSALASLIAMISRCSLPATQTTAVAAHHTEAGTLRCPSR